VAVGDEEHRVVAFGFGPCDLQELAELGLGEELDTGRSPGFWGNGRFRLGSLPLSLRR
jgi:hypothetical protein